MNFTLNTLFNNYKAEKVGIKHYGWRMFALIVIYFVIGSMLAVSADSFAQVHHISEENNWFRIANNLVTTGFSLLLFALGGKFFLKHSFQSLGFSFNNFFKEYPKGMVIGLAMFTLCVLIGMAIGEQTLTYNSTPFSWVMWLSFFGLFFVQGMSEEVIFRSVAFTEISAKWGVPVGFIGSSILFALFHAMNGGSGFMALLNMFLFGLVMAIIYYYTQNIWVSSAVHSIWNFAEGNIFGISISGHKAFAETIFNSKVTGSDFLTGGAFGLEGGIICSIGLIIAGVVLFFAYRKSQQVVE